MPTYDPAPAWVAFPLLAIIGGLRLVEEFPETESACDGPATSLGSVPYGLLILPQLNW